jgi:transposase
MPFVRWRRAGVWARIMNALAGAHDADRADNRHVYCSRASAGRLRHSEQKTVHGSNTRRVDQQDSVVDTNGLPMRLALTAGEAHDNRLAGNLLSHLKSGTMLLADRGYDAYWIRALPANRCAWANIPPRSNRIDPICFSPCLYRARNVVERFLNKIKQCRSRRATTNGGQLP